MQIGLYTPNHVLLKYKLKLHAGVLLNYYADASWKYDKFLVNGDLYVRAEYDFDIVVKNAGIRAEMSKRSFVQVLHDLDDAGVIVKLYDKKKLYIHVFPSVIHDLKNAKIIIDDEEIDDSGAADRSQDDLSPEPKEPKPRSASKNFEDFYLEIKSIYPKKIFTSNDKTKIKLMKLIDRREDFIKSIHHLNMTEKVESGFAPKLINFLKEWENYVGGIPDGEKPRAGIVPQKISNAAGSEDDQFEAFVRVLRKFIVSVEGMSWDDISDRCDETQLFVDGSTEQRALSAYGGLKWAYQHSDSDDFKSDLYAAWESVK